MARDLWQSFRRLEDYGDQMRARLVDFYLSLLTDLAIRKNA